MHAQHGLSAHAGDSAGRCVRRGTDRSGRDAYNIRGDFQLTRKLTLESGNYLSSTTYFGTRFDPRDGLIYRSNPYSTVRAAYGSAYVAPYYGLINTAPYVSSGTLNLATDPFKPETSSGYDIGTDFNAGRNTLISPDGYFAPCPPRLP